MLPGEDGLSICRRLRAANDVTPIIMLTAKVEDVDRIVGLEVGADDYLPKPFNPRELLARIHAVLRRRPALEAPGAPALDAQTVTFGPFVFDLALRRLTKDGEQIALTTGEFSMLKALVRHPRQPLSRDKLAQLARGREFEPFDRSLDVQISRLRKMIEPDPTQPRYIQTVWGVGYVFVPGRRGVRQQSAWWRPEPPSGPSSTPALRAAEAAAGAAPGEEVRRPQPLLAHLLPARPAPRERRLRLGPDLPRARVRAARDPGGAADREPRQHRPRRRCSAPTASTASRSSRASRRSTSVKLTPREPSDKWEPFEVDRFQRVIERELRDQLGPDTIVASSMNGTPGLWVGFSIARDSFWLKVDPTRVGPMSTSTIVLWVSIALLATVLGSAGIARLINRPLKDLSFAASRIREGEYDSRLDETTMTSEIRQVNMGFNRMARELAKVEQDRAVMLAGISHDLRTPLSSPPRVAPSSRNGCPRQQPFCLEQRVRLGSPRGSRAATASCSASTTAHIRIFFFFFFFFFRPAGAPALFFVSGEQAARHSSARSRPRATRSLSTATGTKRAASGAALCSPKTLDARWTLSRRQPAAGRVSTVHRTASSA